MTPKEGLEQQKKYDGVKRWNDAGYTGKGVVIWNTESDRNEHGEMVSIRIRDAAPEATIISASLSMASNSKKVHYAKATLQDGTQMDVEELIQKYHIKLITRSVGGGTVTDTPESRYWNELKEKYNLIFFASAGNDGSEGCGSSLPADVAIYVGACGLNNQGKPVRDNYSGVGPEIDFLDFRGFYSGTSFSAPYLCGKTALLIQRYGNDLTQDDVYEYFVFHSEDLEEVGMDERTGYGLPVLGDIEEEFEIMREPKIITMTIGSNEMFVDGQSVKLDQPPIVDQKTYRTLVPVRAIAEAFGADVEWDQKTLTVTIRK